MSSNVRSGIGRGILRKVPLRLSSADVRLVDVPPIRLGPALRRAGLISWRNCNWQILSHVRLAPLEQRRWPIQIERLAVLR